jgi:hypothetical protein
VIFTIFATIRAIPTKKNVTWTLKDACTNIAIRIKQPALRLLIRVKLRQKCFSLEQPRWDARASSMHKRRLAIVLISRVKIKSRREPRTLAENYDIFYDEK